jgi:surface antigen
MFTAIRPLIPALGLAALLCAQAPAWADPPSWANGETEHQGDRDEARDDRPPEGYDRHRDHRDEDRHDYDRRDDRRGDRDSDRDEEYRRGNRGYQGYGGYYGNRGYRGYGGDDWSNDYGVVRQGRCNTDSGLTVFGAIAGGIIGNSTASPANRGVATVFGAIAGGILGNALGSAIDDGDRACIGHSLELVPIGRPVRWRNPHSRIGWLMTPVRDVSRNCREFDLVREYGGRYGHERVIACRRERGDWEFQGR